MLNNVTIGQFFPSNSLIHKLDPRVKILSVFVFILLVFICTNYISQLTALIAILLVMAVSKVPLGTYFKSLKPVWFILAFTCIINLFYGTGEPLFKMGFLTITQSGLNNSLFIGVRIIALILISSVLTFTTSPTDLTDGLERIMKPLKVFKVPVHDIAMMMTIALRFVPTLIEEADRIMDAQKARGSNIDTGGIMQRARAVVPILIPLFVSAFRRAYDLSIAMECRCYQGGESRTRLKTLKVGNIDILFIIFMVLLTMGVVVCNVKFPKIMR